MSVLYCTLYIILALLGFTFMKLGNESTPIWIIPMLNIGISVKLIIGVVLYGIAFIILTFYISKMNISIAIPIVSGIYIGLVSLVGVLVFGETVNIHQIIGILFIIAGTVMLGVIK